MSGSAPDGAHAEQRWNDAALAQPVAAPAWRLWRYDRPAIVLGVSQRARRDAAAAAAPLDVLVRAAGGGAVLVGPWMIGLSVALPAAHALVGHALVDSYRWLGEGIAEALRDCGVCAARALPPEDARARPRDPDLDWACFGGLSPWEVVVGERKIAGLAQVRRRHGVLLVGGVLLDEPPWDLLCRAMQRGDAQADRLRRSTTACAPQTDIAPGDAVRDLARDLGRRLGRSLGSTAAG